MIQSFANKMTEDVWMRKHVPALAPELQRQAKRKLNILNAAENLRDCNSPPGNRLEKLQGDRAEQHSIRINDQYRICFIWTDQGPRDVEITNHYK